MQTPVLSKFQQKATLSAKKKKKVPIKNVLASPYVRYWPLVSKEDNRIITDVLQNHLPRVRNPQIKVPWNLVKDIPRSERKAFRERYVTPKQDTTPINCQESADLIFGINKVTTSLEKKEVLAVLIASDVRPKFLVNHVIDLAVLNNIPVLLVVDLRSVLSNNCGISSLILGLKNTVTSNTKLSLIHEKIKQVYNKHPVPSKHINYSRRNNRSVDAGATDILRENDGSIDSEKNTEQESSEPESKQEVDKKTGSRKTRLKEESEEDITSQFYLYKKSPNDVAFVPRGSSCGGEQEPQTMETAATDFIGFYDDTPSQETPGPSVDIEKKTNKINNNSVNSVNYKALIVKRLKGDSNRNKRKIEKMKKKKS